MRQKEKRRIKRTVAEKLTAKAKLHNQANPLHSDYVSITNAECLQCGCEFDPKLYIHCPSCMEY